MTLLNHEIHEEHEAILKRGSSLRWLRADECLEEITKGVGDSWRGLPLYGATRGGIAMAKEPVGKSPGRYKPVTPGTVFYNPMRILLGSIAMVDEGDAGGITSPDYVVVRGRPGVLHSRVFYYWLRSSAGEQLIKELARGGVRERIMFARLREAMLPVPPWDVQENLARKLAIYPCARAAAQARLAAAESLPAALLREVFEGPDVSRWETVPLGELCDFKNGLNFRSDRAGGHGVKIIGVGDFQSHLFVPVASLSEVHPTERLDDEFLIRKDDIVFVRSNGNPELVGRSMIVPELTERVTFTGFSIRARPRGHRADPLFLAYYFKSGDFMKRIRGAGRGSNIRNLSQDLLSELETPLPPLPNQRRIAADVGRRLAAADGVIARCREELVAVDTLPAALLREAFDEGGDHG